MKKTSVAKKIEKKSVKDIVKPTDLRSITRDSERLLTTVTIDLGWHDGHELKFEWLKFGQADLRTDSKDGRSRLEAHLTGSACDFEHDTAWALKLPLIGLRLGELAVWGSCAHFNAWIDPDAGGDGGDFVDFHVPLSGYNPMEHPKAEVCEGIYDEKRNLYCKWGDGKKHIIVPEGFYVPPFDAELYRAVRGKRVEIMIGHARSDES